MNKRFFLIVLFEIISLSIFAQASEISLFDSNGNAQAYIANDLTIYLWSGEPTAYLFQDSRGTHIYGFNGLHLGWFLNGIIYDHGGRVVGAILEAFSGFPRIPPVKSLKQLTPLKGIRRLPPVQPRLILAWSSTSLLQYLISGR